MNDGPTLTYDTRSDMPENNPLPGWYRDPSGFGEGRYWDGAFWSSSVSRGGATIDAPINPEHLAVPPVPGSEFIAPAPVRYPVAVKTNGRSSSVAIIGGIAAVLVGVLILLAVNSGDSSNDDTPPATNPPATEAPAAPDTTG